MGTLHHQEPRQKFSIGEEELVDYIETLQSVAKKTKLTIGQVIKVAEVKELQRKNNLYHDNGDIHDEQMSGFGELIDKIDTTLERIAVAQEQSSEIE